MTPPREPKSAPFSLRLTFEERAILEKAAGDMPLGAFIKRKAFDGKPIAAPRRGRRYAVADHQALAQVLALLGQSRLSSNLNQLAHAANTGSLLVTNETEKALREAAAEVAQMRKLLLQALGQRTGLNGPSG